MKNKKISINDAELCVFDEIIHKHETELIDEISERFEKASSPYRDEVDDLPEDFHRLRLSIDYLQDLISLKRKIHALAEKK